MCIANELLLEFETNVKNIKDLTSRCRKQKSDLYSKLSHCDLELTDLRHALCHRKELKLTAVKLVQISIRMSEVEQERLSTKNELEILEKLQSIVDKFDAHVFVPDKIKNNVSNTIEKQNKAYYKPRTEICKEMEIYFVKR